MGHISFSLSPSVNIFEYDLTIGVPVVSSSIAALAGVFRWGPIGERVLIPDESVLVQNFGQPTNINGETWFTAASFLDYGNQLYISRAANTTGLSPIDSVTVQSGNATVTGLDTTLFPDGNVAGYTAISANTPGILAIGAVFAQTLNSTAGILASNSFALGSGTIDVQWVSNSSTYSAIANTAQVANLSHNVIKNATDFAMKEGTFDSDAQFIARYPGELGNSIRVTMADSSNAFSNSLTISTFANGGANLNLLVGSNNANIVITYVYSDTNNAAAQSAVLGFATTFRNYFNVNDLILFGNSDIGTQVMRITEVEAPTATADPRITSNGTVALAFLNFKFEDHLALVANQSLTQSITRYWQWYTLLQTPPGQSPWMLQNGNTAAMDELHIVVVDEGGKFTGVPGTVLETYRDVSRATDAKTLDGDPNFYIDIINQNSQFVWAVNPRSVGYVNTGVNLASTTNNTPYDKRLALGSDGADEDTCPMNVLVNAYDLFASAEDVDVSLILQGKARGGLNDAQLAQWLIDNIALKRLDVVVFVSPQQTDLVDVTNDNTRINNVLAYRNDLSSTSYAFMDGNYKYMFDKYNNLFRWVPFNGDMAGLAVRTDFTNAPWWSFAGYNRGILKNTVRLAWNPRKAYRDVLYPNNINPIIHENGIGNFLFGDKTLLSKESAFSRINVRRLFIYLEKAIADTAKYFLFEFNDAFTRALFVNAITPTLKMVKSQRGIQDFDVVCDESNNGPDVVDAWTMNADIYIKPARAINWINLNFIAVRSGVTFAEVVGIAF